MLNDRQYGECVAGTMSQKASYTRSTTLQFWREMAARTTFQIGSPLQKTFIKKFSRKVFKVLCQSSHFLISQDLAWHIL